MCAKKRIDGLKCDFQPPQPEWSVRARVQADVAEFLIGQFYVCLRPVLPCGLRVADGLRIPVPLRTHLDGRAIHWIQQQGTSSISAQLQLDSAESADDHVLEDLFRKRAE